MRIGQKPLAHAHRQERDAALLDQSADRVIGLRVCRAFAENDQRTLGALQYIERTFDSSRCWNLRRRRVDHLHERFLPGLGVHHLTEKLGGQVEIDAPRTAGHGRADRARQANADVRCMQHSEGRLTKRLGDRQLVHLFVVALLQVDDLTFGRAGDQDHREAVGRGVGERGQAVEKAWSRHGQADARLFRQVAGDRGGITGVLFVPERDDADARGLRHTAEVRDRDAGHTVDRIETVELERIDDEMKAVGQLALCSGCFRGRRRLGFYYCFSHGNPPLTSCRRVCQSK